MTTIDFITHLFCRVDDKLTQHEKTKNITKLISNPQKLNLLPPSFAQR